MGQHHPIGAQATASSGVSEVRLFFLRRRGHANRRLSWPCSSFSRRILCLSSAQACAHIWHGRHWCAIPRRTRSQATCLLSRCRQRAAGQQERLLGSNGTLRKGLLPDRRLPSKRTSRWPLRQTLTRSRTRCSGRGPRSKPSGSGGCARRRSARPPQPARPITPSDWKPCACSWREGMRHRRAPLRLPRLLPRLTTSPTSGSADCSDRPRRRGLLWSM